MCAIVGLIDAGNIFSARDRSRIMRNLAVSAECRGTDATGFAYNHSGFLNITKRPVPAHRMKLKLPDNSRVIVGHTRMATQGKAQLNYNNHPFIGKTGKTHFALVHNGILYNEDSLRTEHHLPETKIETDSYIAVQLIERQKSLSFSSLRFMAEQVSGIFTFAVLDCFDNTWIVKGENPVCVYRSREYEFIVYASTEEILTAALKATGIDRLNYENIKLTDGEILKISADGQMERGEFDLECRFDFRMLRSFRSIEESEYLSELKSVARYYGYSPEELDMLFAEGFTCQEIEEMLAEPISFGD